MSKLFEHLVMTLPLPKYERAEGAFATAGGEAGVGVFAPAVTFEYRDATSIAEVFKDVTWYHTSVDIPGYPNLSAVIEREITELRRRNADLQQSNNLLLERARRAEERANRLELLQSDGA